MTGTVISLFHWAIERANPGLSEREIDLLFVKYHYGSELAERVQEYMELLDDKSSSSKIQAD
jgi:hypothetical protein